MSLYKTYIIESEIIFSRLHILFLRINVTEKNFCHAVNWTIFDISVYAEFFFICGQMQTVTQINERHTITQIPNECSILFIMYYFFNFLLHYLGNTSGK